MYKSGQIIPGASVPDSPAWGRAEVAKVSEQLDRAEKQYRQGHLEEALRLFQSTEIPATMPNQRARKHHNYGVILIQLGRHEDAVPHLESALNYDVANAPAAHLLAVLAWRDGDIRRAHEMTDVALSIDPGYGPTVRLKTELLRVAPRSQR